MIMEKQENQVDEVTNLVKWIKANCNYKAANTLSYVDFPSHFYVDSR